MHADRKNITLEINSTTLLNVPIQVADIHQQNHSFETEPFNGPSVGKVVY